MILNGVVIYDIVQVASAVVLVGSIISSVMPPPVSAADVGSAGLTFHYLRETKLYLLAYKIANACAINRGWAKNLSDPKSKLVIQQFVSILATLISKRATEAAGSTTVAPFNVDASQIMPEVTQAGELNVTDKNMAVIQIIATGIAAAATAAASNK